MAQATHAPFRAPTGAVGTPPNDPDMLGSAFGGWSPPIYSLGRLLANGWSCFTSPLAVRHNEQHIYTSLFCEIRECDPSRLKVNLSNIYRTSIEHPSNIYRTSIEQLSKSINIYRTSIEHLSNIYRTSIEKLSNIYRKSIEHLSNIYRPSSDVF